MNAYDEGFVKQCAARGVDPEALVKWAQAVPWPIGLSAPGGSALGAGVGGVTGMVGGGLKGYQDPENKEHKIRSAILSALGYGAAGAAAGGVMGGVTAGMLQARQRDNVHIAPSPSLGLRS